MASTPTVNYGWNKPATGDVAWDTTYNSNYDTLDTGLFVEHNADYTHKASTFSGNVDINGNDLIIDTDGDSYLHESADDVVDLVLAGASGEFAININAAEDFTFTANSFNVLAGSTIVMAGNFDLNGQDLLLDADADSYLHESADDVIDLVLAGASGELGIHINGAEDFTFTANSFNVLSGSSIVMADGATLGQAAGPLLTFDDTLNYLEVMGCTLGIGTASPDRLLHAELADAVTNAVTYAQRLSHITSDTAVAGFGTGVEFELEENDASFRVAAAIEALWTDAGETTNADADFVFKLMLNDGAAAEKGRLTSGGDFKVSGDYYSGGNQGLSGTLTVDDGANWRFSLTFVGGILTGQTTAGTTAALCTWA